MSTVQVVSRTQKIVMNPAFSAFTVETKLHKIVVTAVSGSISVINAGPMGPTGPQGPAGSVITAWTGVTFQNGWANFGGSEQNVQYRKNGDVVEMRGVMKNGSLGAPAFTLPAGFRPPSDLGFLQEAGGGTPGVAAFAVYASGICQCQPAWGVTGSYVRTNFQFSTIT